MLLLLLSFLLAPHLKPPSGRVFPCAEVFVAGSVPAEVFAFAANDVLSGERACAFVWDVTGHAVPQPKRKIEHCCYRCGGWTARAGQHRDQTSRWGTSLAAPCALFLHPSTGFALLRQRRLLDPAEDWECATVSPVVCRVLYS